ncbi:2-succinyl-5-enolpyruvyl-6-hydroxy-3-cyclohexene-1-carboxylate synthase [Mucilaginibacter terrae]|uniref:2-succinyl-5-enolpyruvyl-6-hydroxy-3-cyclohexene-1-carboxylate synthase n=1 Tax=Mucilaginibacter terrae TaxID=1955052 RepID=A0ABU3H033_9SPHI|nr:2-succinyl-5-enolpyruvyl-6-hydroxy-3-cyclohexene-1-carboxylate synthase [Mucilaginibacter terrae]
MVGIIIEFGTEATSKAVNKYIFKKYPQHPVVLEKQVNEPDNNNKYRLSSSAYLWRNVQ